VTDSRGQKTDFNRHIYPICNAAITSPPLPVNIKVQNLQPKAFDIVWEHANNTNDIYSFEIYVNGHLEKLIGSLTTSYTLNRVRNLSANEVFNISIVCTNNGGLSSKSQLNYTVPGSTLDAFAPSAFYITNTTYANNQLALSWSASSDPNSVFYDVFLNDAFLISTNQTSIAVSNPQVNSQNVIWVQARDNSLNTTATKTVSFSGCASNLTINNAVIKLNYSEFSKNKFISNSVIDPQKIVKFESDKYIELKPGFVANNTSVFTAQIKNCPY
jgi:hypothetical protein